MHQEKTRRPREKGERGSARQMIQLLEINLEYKHTYTYSELFWNGKLLVHKEEEELVTDSLYFLG